MYKPKDFCIGWEILFIPHFSNQKTRGSAMHVYQLEGWTTEGTSPQAGDDTSTRLAPLLSYAQLLNILFYVFNFTIPISFFGILTNITNILVFYKMGFSSPSNLSLFCLAISDLLCLCYILIVSFGNHPLLLDDDLPMSLADVTRTGANVYWASAAIGAWITAVITVERSCCVAFPIKLEGWTTDGTSPRAGDDTSTSLAPLLSYAQLLNIFFYIFSITIPVSFFGVLTNITNILVFYKMGFSSPSNLSLFCLAISDLLCLCYILIVSFGNHPMIT
ncbi:hypothetical protein EGW08_003775 [Elysia chlorotica]|uniref:G-protein coupled receptors family 1 profile domain-containing protein n=1 Tax=Elysia chlorotica TaxID=188477 RepID=A0A3S0ZXI1_ELYCH|nr:hypothetical protein EGW08_003775 [Elysia chlorotica]